MAVSILGSVNRDVVARVASLPRPGETVAAAETMLLPGGKGLNQAVAAARMGARVRMTGAVGRDPDGDALLAALTAERVDVTAVARLPGISTGAAYITVDAAGENQIVVAAGANGQVDPAAARVALGDRVCLAQLEVPVAAVRAFFSAATGTGARRILNAAPAVPEAASLFPLVDVLVVNEIEVAAYLGIAVETIGPGVAAAIRRLLPRPEQTGIVTLGAAGVVLVADGDTRHLPAREVDVIDTTGAGDCYCGVLAALIDEGAPLADAAARAGLAASLCVGRTGAAPAMPTRAELDAIGPSE